MSTSSMVEAEALSGDPMQMLEAWRFQSIDKLECDQCSDFAIFSGVPEFQDLGLQHTVNICLPHASKVLK